MAAVALVTCQIDGGMTSMSTPLTPTTTLGKDKLALVAVIGGSELP